MAAVQDLRIWKHSSLLRLTVLAPCAALACSLPGLPSQLANPGLRQEDPVARLLSGGYDLEGATREARLGALLDRLGIDAASQTLVFSKTSFQNASIAPGRARALYFDDRVHVGYVRGSDLVELMTLDATARLRFYTYDLGAGVRADSPATARERLLARGDECLVCHDSSRTRSHPGFLVRSVEVSDKGHVMTDRKTHVTTPQSPFAERWGGWVVTGAPASLEHMGNRAGDRLLDGAVNAAGHLEATSDAVALMVLEHQCAVFNAIARAKTLSEAALLRQRAANRVGGEAADFVGQATLRVLNDCADDVVAELFFKDEARLPVPITERSAFARAFGTRGKRDGRGRSLRDFDLEQRLFRYPLSYLMDHEALRALPLLVRERMHDRMDRVLTGRLSMRTWGIPRATRREILEILEGTRGGLAAALGLPDRPR